MQEQELSKEQSISILLHAISKLIDEIGAIKLRLSALELAAGIDPIQSQETPANESVESENSRSRAEKPLIII